MTSVEAPLQPAGLQLAGVYLQPFNEVVRPERVWKITKYFLRRWTPYLSASSVWLVIGARQESYFNGNRPWFTAYDQNLAAAAGVHVRSFRRSAKKAIAAGEGPLGAFISKQGDPGYVSGHPTPRQEETRYEVRLDDPLTPADAAALAFWLRRRAPERVSPGAILDLLLNALQEAPRQLRAARAGMGKEDGDWAEALPLLTVADVVAHVFPAVAEESGWREAADRLHTHIVEPHLCHLESQYLRRKWLSDLGPGPALLLVYLRSLCYHNPQTGETRDTVTVLSGELESFFQKSSVTVRAWFSRLDELLGAAHPHGPFVEQLSATKLPSQKVETSYRLNLLTPLHPDDLARYRELVADQPPLAPANGNGQPHREGVNKDMSATPEGGHETFVSHTERRGERNVSHVAAGDESSVSHGTSGEKRFGSHVAEGGERNDSHDLEGEQSFDRRWGKKWQPYKYYKHFLTALVRTFGLKTIDQEQHQMNLLLRQTASCWKFEGEAACQTFAAAAAGNLEGLLDNFGVQGQTRRAIAAGPLALEEVLGWYLYAEQEAGLEHPARYMMKQSAAGEPVPALFAALAALSWEQWRTYAGLCYLRRRAAPTPPYDDDNRWPLFDEWSTVYGDLLPDALPFGVGEGLVALCDAATGRVQQPLVEKGAHSTAGAFQSGQQKAAVATAVLCADAALWQAVRAELAEQMTRATFDAWLRDATFQERNGDTFVIAVRDEAAVAWLAHRLRIVVERGLSAVAGREMSVQFVVQEA